MTFSNRKSLGRCRRVAASMLAAAFMVTVTALASDLTIIQLHHRSAEEMLPVLRPLLEPGAALSGSDYQLFVRADPATLARIREVLAALDRSPRQLLVSVRFDDGRQRDADTVAITGRVDRTTSLAARGGAVARTASDSNVSTVRVLEGNGAHIDTGQSQPYITAVLLPTHGGGQASGVAFDYREQSTGFTVRPRVSGEQVILDVSARHDVADGSGPSVRTDSTAAGRLGEWIELGSVGNAGTERGAAAGGLSHHLSTQTDTRSIAVKVELAE